MSWLVVALAWAIGQTKNLVWLLDVNGQVSLSIARRNCFGQWVADRYPFYPGLYTVVLLNGGAVRGYQVSCYVTRWVSWLQ
jgi:hypothetical protein